MTKTFIFMFGLLALVNAAPQNGTWGGGPRPYKRPPPYPKSHENTKDKREANPDPIHPSIHTSDGIDKRITEPEQTPTKYENTKDKREANPEAWDLQEEDVYGEPRRRVHARWNRTTEPEQPAKHENTKDKREAIPDGAHAGYPYAYTDPAYQYKYEPARYEQREKREDVLRHPDVITIDVPDYGVGYGAPAAVYEREKREEQRYPDYQFAAADNLGYGVGYGAPLAAPHRYERREKREEQRHPDVITIDAAELSTFIHHTYADFSDYGVGYGPPPPAGYEREKREEQQYPDYQIAAADNLDYGVGYGAPPAAPHRHRNTKDKREANPEAWVGLGGLNQTAKQDQPAKHDYERREKRDVNPELLRHPDVITIDVPDYSDYGVGYGAPPAVYEREKREEQRYPADNLEYGVGYGAPPAAPHRDAAGFSNPSGQAVRRAREFQPTDYPDYEPRWPGKQT